MTADEDWRAAVDAAVDRLERLARATGGAMYCNCTSFKCPAQAEAEAIAREVQRNA